MKKKIDDMNWRNAFRDVPEECHNAAMSAAYSVQEPEERRRAGFRLHPVLIAVLITIAMTSVAIAAGSLLGWFDFLDQHQSVGIPQTARDAVQTPYQAEWHVGPVRFTVQELLADKQIAVSTTTAALTDGSQALFTDDPYGKIGSSTSGEALAQRLGVAPETTWVEAASSLDLPLYNVRVMFDIMSECVGGEAMADYMWNEDGSIAYFNLASLNSESIPSELELSFYLSAEQLDPATGRVINRWTDDTHVITVQVGSLIEEKEYAPYGSPAICGYTVDNIHAERYNTGVYLTIRFTATDEADKTMYYMLSELLAMDGEGKVFPDGMSFSGSFDLTDWPQLEMTKMLGIDQLPDTIMLSDGTDNVTLK